MVGGRRVRWRIGYCPPDGLVRPEWPKIRGWDLGDGSSRILAIRDSVDSSILHAASGTDHTVCDSYEYSMVPIVFKSWYGKLMANLW